MPPLHPGEPDDGGSDDHDPASAVDPDADSFRPPLPPEDRLWRHPSEVARAGRHPTPPSPAPAPAPATTRRAPGRWRTVALAGSAAAVGALVAVGALAALGLLDERVVESVRVQPASELGGVAGLVEGTAPSVAAVVVERADGPGAGSAVVLRSDGYLLTDAEVVRGAVDVDVVTHDGTVAPAEVIGTDELTGVAVLRVDVDGLVAAPLGRSTSLTAGTRTVLVAAVADGGWHESVATGVVSTLAPRIEGADGSARYGMIVVDAPFADGTAGGAVVDGTGAVVGIAAAPPRADELRAHGLVTPIELAEHVADQLIAEGRAHHVWLGLQGSDLSPDEVATAGTSGARIEQVAPGSPAAHAGLVPGDLVVGVDGTPIPSMAALIGALRLHLPGDVVVLEVHRDSGTTDVRVDLAARDG